MTLKNKKTIALLSTTVMMLILSTSSSSFAQTPPSENVGEQVSAKTDKTVYQYGDTIHLTIDSTNFGSQHDILAFKNQYAGIDEVCGPQYLDFAFLSGDYNSVSTYDELLSAKPNLLNVVNPVPDGGVSCPFGYTNSMEKVSFDHDSDMATVTVNTNHGKVSSKDKMALSYEITNTYGKTVNKQLSPDQTLVYKESNILPTGKYTVIAFTLSGKISKPVIIDVVNTSNTSLDLSKDPQVLQTVFSDFVNSGFASLFVLPAVFGTVMAVGKKQQIHVSKTLSAATICAVMVFGIVTATTAPAFATYNVGSQGVEAHSTTSTFNTATVEERFEGVIIPTGSSGLSLQNNHYVHGFTIGTGYLWVQSLPRMETGVTTSNSHTCTTQAGSYTCKLLTDYSLLPWWNFWTHKDIIGNCPSGWSHYSNECYSAPTSGTWQHVYPTSSTTRLDLNAYATIQSTGKIYVDQKYRTCTGSFSCTGYTILGGSGYTTPTAYAQSPPNSYFDLTTYFGGTTYGLEGPLGEGGGSTVTFSDGTYGTETYTINSSGSPVYRASGTTTNPAEQNANICWWNSITNPGGSNPTYTATAQYGSCHS